MLEDTILLNAGAAFMTALCFSLCFGQYFIRQMRRLQCTQVFRQLGPDHHQKAGTPTMGGGLIVMATLIATLCWAHDYAAPLWMVLYALTVGALIGFCDDFQKKVQQSTAGMGAGNKLIAQLLLGLSVALWHVLLDQSILHVPGTDVAWVLPIILAVPLMVLVIVSTSNAVNLTDGLDGLATVPSIMVAAVLGIVAYMQSQPEWSVTYFHTQAVPIQADLAVFSAALIGALLSFLFFNRYPAQIFMGDLGSLAIGSALATLAIATDQMLLLILLAAVFVFNTISVILQVLSYRLRGRRIFKMAPWHHHLECQGWSEQSVVWLFWGLSVFVAGCSLGLIFLQGQ